MPAMIADVPKKYRKIYERAKSGHSRKDAIHIHCLKCMGWGREEVRRCSDLDCSLLSYRPYQLPPRAEKRQMELVESKKTELLIAEAENGK